MSATNTNITNQTVIRIDDVIDDFFGFTARELEQQINNTPKDEEIVVAINSPGGEVFEGIQIASVIASSDRNITTRVTSLAASIASVIALSGDRVVMERDSMLMIHNPFSIAFGEAKDFQQAARTLNKIKSTIVGAYIAAIESRGKLINGSAEETQSKLNQMMNAETWLTAQEALEFGFIDEVIDPRQNKLNRGDKEEKEDDNGMHGLDIDDRFYQQLAKYQNTPNKILNQYKKPEMEKESKKKVSLLKKISNFFTGIKDEIDALEAPEVDETPDETIDNNSEQSKQEEDMTQEQLDKLKAEMKAELMQELKNAAPTHQDVEKPKVENNTEADAEENSELAEMKAKYEALQNQLNEEKMKNATANVEKGGADTTKQPTTTKEKINEIMNAQFQKVVNWGWDHTLNR